MRTLNKPNAETVEEYLKQHSVLDGKGNMDGHFVPLSVAHLAAELLAQDKLKLEHPSWIKK